jgi:hypothetical protein
MNTPLSILDGFSNLTKIAKTNLKNNDVSELITKIVMDSLEYLSMHSVKENIISKIPNKTYFQFRLKNDVSFSRPVNSNLFVDKIKQEDIFKILKSDINHFKHFFISQLIYTMAMSYCCAVDLLKKRDQKTPGTYFEILIGHIFSVKYNMNPDKKIQVINLDKKTTLPTDFVFNLGTEKSRIHLPIKTSTRERVIQVWAHQRVIDGVYGVNKFRGILVCINETNKQSKDNSVIEVCLPGQWAIYQMYIARMYRIYYLDIPEKYALMSKAYPFIQVKEFADFFNEADDLVVGQSI